MDYGICDEARRSKCSSYAFAKGCYRSIKNDYRENSTWWIRRGNNSEYATQVDYSGWAYDDRTYNGTNNDGVRPALYLKLSSSNVYSYAGTVCSDGTNNTISKTNSIPSNKTTAAKKPTKPVLLPVEKMTGSLKAVKSPKKSTLTITWKKLSKITGYHVQFSAKRNFSKGTIERKFKKKVTKTQVRPLKSKKKYYVRMRPYTKSGSKMYYGKWSKVKSVKIK